MTSLNAFTLFPQLPPEIRLRIWNLNLPTTRIVSIHCGSDLLDSPPSSFPLQQQPSSKYLHHHHSSNTTRRTYSSTEDSSDSDSPSRSSKRKRTSYRRPSSPSPSPSTHTGYTSDAASSCFSFASTFGDSISRNASGPGPSCTSSSPIPPNLHTCAESRAHALTKYRLSFSYARQQPRVYFNPATDILYFGHRPGYMASNSQFHTFMSMIPAEEIASVRRIAVDDALFRINHTSSNNNNSPQDSTTSSPQYWSLLAVSLATDCLRQIRQRMPHLDELFFVPRHDPAWHQDPIAVRDLLSSQVMTAIQDLNVQVGGWNPPQWSVLSCPLSTSRADRAAMALSRPDWAALTERDHIMMLSV